MFFAFHVARDNDGDTPLHEAVYRRHLESVEYLIKHGANVNKINKQGKSPLRYVRRNQCMLQEDPDVINMLREMRALRIEFIHMFYRYLY